MADDLIDRLTQDPDFLSLSEADQDAMYEELSGRQAKSIPVQPFATRHPLVANPAFQATVSRPAAIFRGAIRAMKPGGETPQEALSRGVFANEEELVERAQPFNLQRPLIERYYQDVAERHPGINPTPLDVLRGFGVSAIGLAGETAANVASNPIEALAALIPFSRAGQATGQAIAASQPGQAIGRELLKSRRTPLQVLRGRLQPVSEAFSRPKVPTTPSELVALPESTIAKLRPLEREQYFSSLAQQEQARLAQVAQQERAVLAAKRQAQQQALEVKRLDFQEKAQKAQQFIQDRELSASRSLPSTAAEDLSSLNESFRPLAKSQSDSYRNNLLQNIREAEAASGQRVTFTRQELVDEIANKFLKPGQVEEPIEYRNLIEKLSKHKIVNKNEITPEGLIKIADDEFATIRTVAKNKGSAYTPDEVASQHLRDVLLNLVEKKGIPVFEVKDQWAKWVPTRNLGLKLQGEAGPGKLIQVLKGRNPVAAKNLDNLEALLGERLDRKTTQLFEQLDYLEQRKVVEQAKQFEFKRVMLQEKEAAQQQLAAMQTLNSESAATRQAISYESMAARKLRIEQQARHYADIRKLVYGAAASIPTIGGAIGLYKKFRGE